MVTIDEDVPLRSNAPDSYFDVAPIAAPVSGTKLINTVYFDALVKAVRDLSVYRFAIALSDSSSELEVTTNVNFYTFPNSFTLEKIYLSVDVAPTDQAIIVTITSAGNLFATITLQAGSKYTTYIGAVPALISENTEFKFSITQVGSTVKGSGLTATILGKYESS